MVTASTFNQISYYFGLILTKQSFYKIEISEDDESDDSEDDTEGTDNIENQNGGHTPEPQPKKLRR